MRSLRSAFLLCAALIAAAPARATTWTSQDFGGAPFAPANGDVITGTFTNVGLFSIAAGSTVTIAQGFPVAIYASTINISGTLDGTGLGMSGGGGGSIGGAGQAGASAPGSGGAGAGRGGGTTGPSGGSGGGGGAIGGTGAGSATGAVGVAYGSTGTISTPMSSDDMFMGSGGGGGAGNASEQGGSGANGGGAIYLEAASMTVTGAILVSGDTATAVTDAAAGAHPGGGGGGGGGTILLRIPGILNLTGATLVADGGGGGNVVSFFGGTLDPGGGGGGGRVKIFRGKSSFFSVVISTQGGPKGGSGGFTGSIDASAPGITSGTIGSVSFGVIASSPTSFGFDNIYVTSISWTWNISQVSFGDAPAASDAFRVYPGTATAPLPSPQVTATSLQSGATEQGLVPNTTYYRFVTSFSNWGDSLPSTAVSTHTLADIPAAGSPSFTGMADVSLTVNWTAGTYGNPAYTVYEVNQATSSNFAAPVSTSFVVGLSSTPAGLTPNTSYYFRVRAINLDLVASSFTATMTTATLASLPTGAGFNGIFVSSIVFTWSGGANPVGTVYVAQISTDNFFSVSGASTTLNARATFTGLTPGVLYYFRVEAVNREGVATAYTAAVSAMPGIFTGGVTPPTGPGAPVADRTFSTDGNAVWSWAAASSPAGILDYNLDIGTSIGASDFLSVSTTSLVYAVSGLGSGRTYYAQVRARTNAGVYGSFVESATGVQVFVPSQQGAILKPYNWPNPWDPASGPTQIAFYLDSPGIVVFTIYTLQGRKVRELSQSYGAAGNQLMTWDGTGDSGGVVSPGGYVVAIKSSSGTTKRFKIAVLPK